MVMDAAVKDDTAIVIVIVKLLMLMKMISHSLSILDSK